MKILLKFTFTVLAVAFAFAACNPNGMNDRKETESSTHETSISSSSDTTGGLDTIKGTGATHGSEMSMETADSTTH